MLTLWRRIGRYRKSALVLVYDGQVIGEIVVLQAHGDRFGDAQVQLGLTLPASFGVVRGDALTRPVGPSLDWLVRREAEFELASARRPDLRPLGSAPPFSAVGPYADPAADPAAADALEALSTADCEQPDALRDDDGDDGDEDGDEGDGPGWGQPPAAPPAAPPAPRGPLAPTTRRLPPAAVVNSAATALYAFRNEAACEDREAGR